MMFEMRTYTTPAKGLAARKASEEKTGGSLTVPDGVKSVYLKPTDFSPVK